MSKTKDNVDAGALLYSAAVQSLTANAMSPNAAHNQFYEAIVAAGGMGSALLQWGGKESDDLCLAYLRHVLRAMKNEPEPAMTERARIGAGKREPAFNFRAEPSGIDLERMRTSRVKSYAAIYVDTTIDGRPFHDLFCGEAKSLIPVKRRRAEHHTAEAGREAFEADLLEQVLSHAKAPSDTTPLVDMVSAKQLQKFVAALKEKASV